MYAHCTGALGFLYMEIYSFVSLLWQMGTIFNSVASLLVGKYLRLAESTFSGAEYRKKAFCLAIRNSKARFIHLQKILIVVCMSV